MYIAQYTLYNKMLIMTKLLDNLGSIAGMSRTVHSY